MILTTMIDRFKRGQTVNPNFDEFDDVNHQLSQSLLVQPLFGQTQNIANATQIGRKKSIREIRTTNSLRKRKKELWHLHLITNMMILHMHHQVRLHKGHVNFVIKVVTEPLLVQR